jgi:hypothetical protein
MSSGGAQAARDPLIPAADKFPRNPIIPYNLACYECQMDRLKDAWNWIKLAISLGVSKEFKLMALDEPKLKPLWLAIADI